MLRLRVIALAVLLFAVRGVAGAAPETWSAEIDRLTATDATQPPPAGAVLLVGSSSIRLWTTVAEDFPGVTTINRGFGGSQLTDSTYYFDRIVAPYRPRVIVLYAGDNDIASGRTAEEVLGDFLDFRARVRAGLPDTRLVFLSIKESPSRAHVRDEVRRANHMIAGACWRDPHCRFADVSATLVTPDGAFRTALFEPDGLHINREGYAAWAAVLAPLLKE
jgi:lysophospholipase L1-like esterase